MRIQITGTGLYAPPRVETAESLSPRLHRSPQWIASRTGVLRRHYADEPVEEMAAKAAKEALHGKTPDLLIYASATPRQLIPDTSVFVSRALGYEGIPSHSVHATCLSFVVALHQAAALITVGAYERVLVVSSEIGSRSLDFSEAESAALMGDGAAAALVEKTPDGESSALLAYEMATFPSAAELAELTGAGTRHHPLTEEMKPEYYQFHMNGPRVYRFAMGRLPLVVGKVLARANLQVSDLDLIVPHQASAPGIAGGLAHAGLPPERAVNILAEYGNCIAASIPMALAVAAADGRLVRGQNVLLVGTGAGLSIAAALLRW